MSVVWQSAHEYGSEGGGVKQGLKIHGACSWRWWHPWGNQTMRLSLQHYMGIRIITSVLIL
jgi:hypothetical protein